MNELVAKLAEQAGQESFDSDNDLALIVSTDEKSYQVPAAFIEKFAELIVQECATLAYDGPGGILEHFGVEK